MTLTLAGGAVVVSLDPAAVVRADVRIEDGRVVAVGVGAGGEQAGEGARLDCSGCLVIPGNVCAHTHAYSALARGMPAPSTPPRTFVEILRRVWWRLDRALDPDAIRGSALVAAAEALLAGTTTLVDHHASPDAIDGSLDLVADAFAEVGVRSVLCYETTDRDGPPRARAGIAENERFLRRAAGGATPLARAMVGAHASFTLSRATLDACVDLARASGTGLHVHVAEDAADERDAERRFGTRVVTRLERAGALDDRALLAHAIHLDRAEAALVRASGATVAHNPRSNMNNAVGRAPLGLLGPRVALGTDGIGADMFEESRVARLRAGEEADGIADGGWQLARLAEGARLVGRAFGEPLLGRIEPGAPADIVVLDYAAPTPLTDETVAGHWLYALSARAVRDVLVGGRVVVADRRLALADGAAIAAEGRVQAARLWERMAGLAEHPFDPEGAPVG